MVDWLSNSDHYFMICHAHQGHDDWDVQDLYYEQFPRLWNFFGFPFRVKLTDSITTQDKYWYIFAMSCCIDTLKVDLPVDNLFDESNSTGLLEYFRHCKNIEGRGVVIKHPFVTNSKQGQGIFFCEIEEVFIRYLNKAAFAASLRNLPYLMLQPILDNMKEYKIVVLNGVVAYIARNPHSHNRAWKFSTPTELFRFAEAAVRELAANHPGEAYLTLLIIMDHGDVISNVLSLFKRVRSDY